MLKSKMLKKLMAQPTALRQAEYIEAKIDALRGDLRDLLASGAHPTPRRFALAFLSNDASGLPTPEQIARFESKKRTLEATIAGLIDLRVDLESEILKEAIDKQRSAADAQRSVSADARTRLIDARNLVADLEQAERDAGASERHANHLVADLRTQLAMLDPSAHGLRAGVDYRPGFSPLAALRERLAVRFALGAGAGFQTYLSEENR